MTKPEEASASADNFLRTEMALTVALKAIIKTQPQPALLAQELEQQRQFSQAHLRQPPFQIRPWWALSSPGP